MSSGDDLEQRRRRVEEERLALEERELALKRRRLEEQERSTLQQPPDRVLLDVGGTKFSTSRSTLLNTGSTFFRRLLEEEGNDSSFEIAGAQKDAEGRIFLDKSPDLFDLCLKYLRGSLQVASLELSKRDELLQEATYYDLHQLVFDLVQLKGEYNVLALSAADQEIREQAQNLRAALKGGEAAEAATEADAALIDVLAQPAQFLRTGERTSPLAPLVFEDAQPAFTKETFYVGRNRRAQPAGGRASSRLPAVGTGVSVTSVAEFRASLRAFAGPLLDGLDMTHLLLAGGAVLEALKFRLDQGGGEDLERVKALSSDLDLFIVTADEAQATATFERVFTHLKARLAELPPNDWTAQQGEARSLLVVRSRYAVTFMAGHPHRHVQLVLRRHRCAAEVLFNFDVDCCQWGFDGEKLLCTPSARRAFVSGVNLADPERSSAGYEMRLAKYARRGFAVAVPGLELERLGRKWRDGVFTRTDGALKRVELKFHPGARLPAFEVLPEPVVGLPKLLVLSALRFGTDQANDEPARDDLPPLRPEHDTPLHMAGEAHTGGCGGRTFLIRVTKTRHDSLAAWAESSDIDTYMVWKRPPPAFPPFQLQQLPDAEVGGGGPGPGVLGYGGVMLPYSNGEGPHSSYVRLITAREELNDEHHLEGQVRRLGVCYDLVEVPGNNAPGLPNVRDAYRQEGAHTTLPRRLQFPAADDDGPWYVRTPEHGWFGKVYEA